MRGCCGWSLAFPPLHTPPLRTRCTPLLDAPLTHRESSCLQWLCASTRSFHPHQFRASCSYTDGKPGDSICIHSQSEAMFISARCVTFALLLMFLLAIGREMRRKDFLNI